MIDKGINKICRAFLCQECYKELKETSVVRDYGAHPDGKCDNCGKQSRVVVECRYTLSKRGFDKFKIPY